MAGFDLHGSPFPFGLTFVPPDTLAPLIGTAEVEDPVQALSDACRVLDASFFFVPASAEWAEEAVTKLQDRGVACLWAVDGPLWPVIESRGGVDGIRATLTDPAAVGNEIDQRTDAVLQSVVLGAEHGARALVLAEDLAGSEGPLVAPDFAIAELLPRYARIVEAAQGLSMPTVLHSDGDVRPLLPAIARAGFSAVHAGGGLSLEGFEKLFWAARDNGLAVIGGMVTQELGNLARAEALGSAIGVLVQAGGLLVADDGGITESHQVVALASALAAARAACL